MWPLAQPRLCSQLLKHLDAPPETSLPRRRVFLGVGNSRWLLKVCKRSTEELSPPVASTQPSGASVLLLRFATLPPSFCSGPQRKAIRPLCWAGPTASNCQVAATARSSRKHQERCCRSSWSQVPQTRGWACGAEGSKDQKDCD